jgi:beta-glucanase (GH16 family)
VCSFDDEFDGSTLDRTKWVPQTNFAGSLEQYACFRDDPSNVSVANGAATLTLLKLAQPEVCPTTGVTTDIMSGGISTYHLFSQQYGRFEARIKNTATDAPGLHEAFWLWPDNRVSYPESWPTAGEIDVAETYSNYTMYVLPFLHYVADFLGIQFGVNTNACTAYRGVWNTYTLEWSPNRIEVFVNGQSCLVNTSGDPAFQKAYIMNFTQGIGPQNNMPVAGTQYPASMQIDYVRVWR